MTLLSPCRSGSQHEKVRELLVVCVALVALAGPGLAPEDGRLQAASPAAPQATEFPPVKLRGFGTLAGTFTVTKIQGQSGSAFRILCQDEAKAKLVLAKYLSDLQLLPGVVKSPPSAGSGWRETNRTHRTPLTVYLVENQGFIIAARSGTTVWILARRVESGQGWLVAVINHATSGEPVITELPWLSGEHYKIRELTGEKSQIDPERPQNFAASGRAAVSVRT